MADNARRVPGPQGRVAWGHPLATGLLSAWWPGIIHDPVDGATWTTTGAVAWPAGSFGEARRVVQTTSLLRAPDPMPLGSGSIMSVQRVPSGLTGDGCSIGAGPNAGNGMWGAHLPYGDGNVYFDIRSFAGAGRLVYSGGFAWDEWNVFVLTNGPIGGQSIWGNGAQLANDASAAPDRDGGLQATFGMGHHAGTPQQSACDYSALFAWNRELLANDVAALTADPFCMIDED